VKRAAYPLWIWKRFTTKSLPKKTKQTLAFLPHGCGLDHWLDPTVFRRLPRPYSAGWLAAQVFVKYRRGGGARTSPLPDFYIGGKLKWRIER
jgi:hypothetical protein